MGMLELWRAQESTATSVCTFGHILGHPWLNTLAGHVFMGLFPRETPGEYSEMILKR